MRKVVVAASLAAAWTLAAPEASARDAVRCQLHVMLGVKAPGGIDPRLKQLRRQLLKSPFDDFKTIKLLTDRALRIQRKQLANVALPTGKLLKLTYKEKLLDAKNKVRLRMHLSITPPKTRDFLPGTLFSIADGGTLLVAGERHQGGTLIIGISCRSR